ncbi:innate immunity activator protein [Eudromia elegans]
MEEASDTDSGITLRSGAESPAAPLKELTQAVRQQQRELEARLDACVQELRRLCVREAELTGTLPREFPLQDGEKPPAVRRRVGAAFRLDETLVLRGADPLGALERELALQLQIARAARRLSREDNLGRQQRKRRQSAALREESKLRELESALRRCRLRARAPGASDEGSMSEEEAPGTGSPSRCPAVPAEEPPPAEGRPRSPATLERPPPCGATSSARPYRLVAVGGLVLCQRLGSSAPGTPEPPGRRGAASTTRALGEAPAAGGEGARREPAEPRGPGALPRRRPTCYTVTRVVRTPSLKEAAAAAAGARALSRAAVCEELQWWHERARLRAARPRSLDRLGLPRAAPRIHVLKRSPDGRPVQLYVPENGEIVTQV